MIDESRKGERVQTRTDLRVFQQHFKKGQQGTIMYELSNNIGEILVYVAFDGQGQFPVFREEIEPVPTSEPTPA